MKCLLCRAASLLALLLVLGFASFAEAGVIYSQTQPEDPIGAFSSQERELNGQVIADNFMLSGNAPIAVRSLRLIGGSGLVGSMSDDFRVVFLEDSGGMPGNTLMGGDYSIGPAFDRSPTGGQLLNGVATPHEYIINLPTGITLNPNATYWISVSNNLSPVSGWGWARAGGMFDQVIASTEGALETGPWSTLTAGGMWFELSDQVLPEPSSMTMLLLGLLAIMCRQVRGGVRKWSNQ